MIPSIWVAWFFCYMKKVSQVLLFWLMTPSPKAYNPMHKGFQWIGHWWRAGSHNPPVPQFLWLCVSPMYLNPTVFRFVLVLYSYIPGPHISTYSLLLQTRMSGVAYTRYIYEWFGQKLPMSCSPSSTHVVNGIMAPFDEGPRPKSGKSWLKLTWHHFEWKINWLKPKNRA